MTEKLGKKEAMNVEDESIRIIYGSTTIDESDLNRGVFFLNSKLVFD